MVLKQVKKKSSFFDKTDEYRIYTDIQGDYCTPYEGQLSESKTSVEAKHLYPAKHKSSGEWIYLIYLAHDKQYAYITERNMGPIFTRERNRKHMPENNLIKVTRKNGEILEIPYWHQKFCEFKNVDIHGQPLSKKRKPEDSSSPEEPPKKKSKKAGGDIPTNSKDKEEKKKKTNKDKKNKVVSFDVAPMNEKDPVCKEDKQKISKNGVTADSMPKTLLEDPGVQDDDAIKGILYGDSSSSSDDDDDDDDSIEEEEKILVEQMMHDAVTGETRMPILESMWQIAIEWHLTGKKSIPREYRPFFNYPREQYEDNLVTRDQMFSSLLSSPYQVPILHAFLYASEHNLFHRYDAEEELFEGPKSISEESEQAKSHQSVSSPSPPSTPLPSPPEESSLSADFLNDYSQD